MSAVLLNIAIGLVTSILSGGSVWIWQRARLNSVRKRSEEFFGLKSGVPCLIIMNNKWDRPGAVSHNDVYTMVEIIALAHSAKSPINIRSGDNFNESNGDRTEFCIGGIESNPRTAGHLAAQLPGLPSAHIK